MTGEEFINKIEKETGLKIVNLKPNNPEEFWAISPTKLPLFVIRIYFSNIDKEWRVKTVDVDRHINMITTRELDITLSYFVKGIEKLLGLNMKYIQKQSFSSSGDLEYISGLDRGVFYMVSPTGFELFHVTIFRNKVQSRWEIRTSEFNNKLKAYRYKPEPSFVRSEA